jgi:hypothetical protein
VQNTPTKAALSAKQLGEVRVRNGRHGKSRRAEQHREREMPHTLAGNIARSSPPHHRSSSGAGRQRRNETDLAVREFHRLHDLGQP